jgi:protein TonB
MQIPRHDIVSHGAPGMTPRRAAIIGGVALLHVGIVVGLITGMANKIERYIPKDLVVRMTDIDPRPKTDPVPPTPVIQKAQPTPDNIPVPVITTETPTPTALSQPPQTPTATSNPPPADSGASGVVSTHTVPPYPQEARAAAHQGTVMLQMVISAQGDVTQATVLQSSGFPELDQAAIAWVQSHWKYKPALQNGQAVPSQSQAAVKFDLKQASR